MTPSRKESSEPLSRYGCERTTRVDSLDQARAVRASAQILDQAMSAYADGEVAAFRVLVSGLGPRLRNLLRQMGSSQELADDLAQETFLRIHRARTSFIRGKPVIPWASAIARNCFVSFARARRDTALDRCIDVAEAELPSDENSDAGSALEAEQCARVVSEVLERMPAAHREAFLLLRYEGLSVAAAAGTVGVTEGAFKVRAFRARTALRDALRLRGMGR